MNTNPHDTETVVSETTPETGTPSPADAETTPSGIVSGWRDWRRRRAASAETIAEQKRLLEERRQDEQKALREAANAAARERRQSAAFSREVPDEQDIAPIPLGLRKCGIWVDRSVGGAQMLAPFVVSGFFTIQTGMDEPLGMDLGIAVAFTFGLEGSLWYINRLREKFRLEGDSTFSLAAASAFIICLIAGLIGGHAIWKATGSVPLNVAVPGMGSQVPLSDVVPALAVALMSAIGTFVWSKRDTFRHRAKLRAQGRIDAAAPKFAVASWIFCPWETVWSLRHAVKYRLSSPLVAVEDWRLWKMSEKPKVWPEPVSPTGTAATVETPARQRPLRAVSTIVAETPASSLASSHRTIGAADEPSQETSQETALETVDGTSSVSPTDGERLAEEADQVETVGRLHMEGLSYAKIAERLGMHKSNAGRLGKFFYERQGAVLTAANQDD